MTFRSTVVVCFVAAFPLLAAEGAPKDFVSRWQTAALRAQDLRRNAKFAEAVQVQLTAIHLAKNFGPTDTNLAKSYHLLATIYRDWGHCAESRANFAHALTIWQKQSNPDPHYVFSTLTNLI